MNTSSSRSHAIFSIILKQQITHHDNATSVFAEEEQGDDDITALIENRTTLPQRLVSKFHFVDLAGSERVSYITYYNVCEMLTLTKQTNNSLSEHRQWETGKRRAFSSTAVY